MSKWVDVASSALRRFRHPEGCPQAAFRRARATLAIATFASVALAVAPSFAQNKPPAKAQDASAIVYSGIGRAATSEEIAGWDIDVRPDGKGLPPGKGSVKQGEEIYMNQCAACHGEFGESAGRWPLLAGGAGTLKSHDPVKSVGSYWPYASTLFDYIRRAMPYGNAQSLSNDELYAVTAYVLSLNDIVRDDTFELSDRNFATIKLPNQAFHDDDREKTEKHFWTKSPCMKNCTPAPVKVTGHARVIDVTPEAGKAPKVD